MVHYCSSRIGNENITYCNYVLEIFNIKYFFQKEKKLLHRSGLAAEKARKFLVTRSYDALTATGSVQAVLLY